MTRKRRKHKREQPARPGPMPASEPEREALHPPAPRPGPAPGIRSEPRWPVWLIAAVLVAAGVAAYFNSMGAVFVYDDVNSIQDNHHMHRLWPLTEAIGLPLWEKGVAIAGRPVAGFTFALNYALFGPEPWGYHLVNVAIHIGAALLLFGVARRTLMRQPFSARFAVSGAWVAGAIALIWLVHPLATSAVTYTVQRAESLAGLWYLLTLYCCIRGFEAGGRGWYVAAFGACLLGMGTKEVMFTAPAVVLLYDVIFVCRSFREVFRRRWALYAALAATWVVAVTLFAMTFGEKEPELTALSPLRYLLTQPDVILHYLRLSVWPHPLVMDYNWPAARTFVEVAVPGAVIVLLLSATVYGVIHRRWFGFVGAWFFLILAPTSSIIPIPSAAHEHRMYLSLAGVVALAALGGEALLRRFGRMGRLAAVGLALAAAAGLAYMTHERNKDYRSELVFWRQNAEVRPESVMAHNGYGSALLAEGKSAEAVAEFEMALAIWPRFAAAHNNLGLVFLAQGKLDEAEARFREVIRLAPKSVDGCNNLAGLYRKRKDLRAATEYYEKAMSMEPRHPFAYSGLGEVLAEQGNFDAAVEQCRKAVAIDPDSDKAHNSLGTVLSMNGHLDEAMEEFRRAIALNPKSDGALNNLAIAFFKKGRYDECIAHYEKAVAVNPLNAEAHHNLGQVLKVRGYAERAVEEYLRAIAINPTYGEAHHSLALAYLDQGRLAEAKEHFEKAIAARPEYDLAYNNLGLVYLRWADAEQQAARASGRPVNVEEWQKNLGLAVQCFRKAISLNPDSGFAYNAHNNLGIALLAQGDAAGAILSHEKALELKPDDAGTMNNLAWLLATCPRKALRDSARAIQVAERLCRAPDGKRPKFLYTLAAAYASAGRFEDAVREATRALELAPRSDAALRQQIQESLELYRNGKAEH